MDMNRANFGGMNLSSVISQLLEQNGGVTGLMQKFEQRGLGDVVASWIGHGTNQPISGEQVGSVFGVEKIEAIASKFGITPALVMQKMSEFLPQAVDKMTPEGKVPSAGFSLSSIESLASSFLGRSSV